MKRDYIRQDGVDHKIDFDAHYQVQGCRGIAFFLLGWQATQKAVMCFTQDDEGNEIEVESGEYELVPDYSTVIAVMVGDDRHHAVDIADLHIIAEESFCRSCGQIGCKCNVYA